MNLNFNGNWIEVKFTLVIVCFVLVIVELQ